MFVCGTNPTPRCTSLCGGWPVMSSPSSVTEPDRIDTSPSTAFSNVDLPAPFGPMIPTNSPGADHEVAAIEDVDLGHVAGDQLRRTR